LKKTLTAIKRAQEIFAALPQSKRGQQGFDAEVSERGAMVTRNPLVRAGIWLAELAERWFPDAFVFALLG
jgi:hypothetical protein